MEDAKSYFHIGMSKTGSTYLQKYVFPYLNDFQYFKKHDYLKYKTEIDTSKKLLFSNEKDRGIKKEIDEIKRYRPQSKVIIVFREHFDWIKSKYKYYIRKFGHLGFKDYYETVLIPELNMHENYFTSIIEKLENNFPGRCLYMTYDTFKKNPDFFFQRLHRFMQTEGQEEYVRKVVKPAFSNKQLHYIRKFNRLYTFDKPGYSKNLKSKLNYKYHELLLHTVAQLSKAIPVKGASIEQEISDNKTAIRTKYKKDWEQVTEVAV